MIYFVSSQAKEGFSTYNMRWEARKAFTGRAGQEEDGRESERERKRETEIKKVSIHHQPTAVW